MQKTKRLYKYLKLTQELRKLVIVAKKKKIILRLPFVTHVLKVAQESFDLKILAQPLKHELQMGA